MSVEATRAGTETADREVLEASIAASELLLFCRDLRGTVTDVVVAAAGRALGAHPRAARVGGPGTTGVGVAVDTGDELLVPVVRNAAEAPLPQVRAEVARLVEAARAGRLSSDDLGGAAVVVHDPVPGATAELPGAIPGYVLTIDHPAYDSPELTLALATVGSSVDADAAPFFATLVRLLRHPYRRLV